MISAFDVISAIGSGFTATAKVAQTVYELQAVPDNVKDLLKTTHTITETLKVAKELRSRVPLEKIKKDLINIQITAAENAVNSVVALVEEARVELEVNAKRKGIPVPDGKNLNPVTRVMFLLQSSPKISTELVKLSVSATGLQAAIHTLHLAETLSMMLVRHGDPLERSKSTTSTRTAPPRYQDVGMLGNVFNQQQQPRLQPKKSIVRFRDEEMEKAKAPTAATPERLVRHASPPTVATAFPNFSSVNVAAIAPQESSDIGLDTFSELSMIPSDDGRRFSFASTHSIEQSWSTAATVAPTPLSSYHSRHHAKPPVSLSVRGVSPDRTPSTRGFAPEVAARPAFLLRPATPPPHSPLLRRTSVSSSEWSDPFQPAPYPHSTGPEYASTVQLDSPGLAFIPYFPSQSHEQQSPPPAASYHTSFEPETWQYEHRTPSPASIEPGLVSSMTPELDASPITPPQHGTQYFPCSPPSPFPRSFYELEAVVPGQPPNKPSHPLFPRNTARQSSELHLSTNNRAYELAANFPTTVRPELGVHIPSPLFAGREATHECLPIPVYTELNTQLSVRSTHDRTPSRLSTCRTPISELPGSAPEMKQQHPPPRPLSRASNAPELAHSTPIYRTRPAQQPGKISSRGSVVSLAPSSISGSSTLAGSRGSRADTMSSVRSESTLGGLRTWDPEAARQRASGDWFMSAVTSRAGTPAVLMPGGCPRG